MGGLIAKTFKARKRPVEVTFQVFEPREGPWPQGVDPLLPELATGRQCEQCGNRLETNVHGWVKTLESGHVACPGDKIITGVKGERYPCKPDIFELTYEVLE